MTWPRTGCYTPTQLRHVEENGIHDAVVVSSDAVLKLATLGYAETSDYMAVSDSYAEQYYSSNSPNSANQSNNRLMKCPLHKHIRNKAWPTVSTFIQKNPQQIGQLNRMGWSSLILAVYHDAPVSVIAEMLSLLTPDERRALLSTPVPNGARLCLHFCARFSSNVETFRLLVEAYPLALVVPSADGNRPLDRAIYYHKDTEILRYLEETTKKQLAFIDNIELRRVILDACALQWNRMQSSNNKPFHFILPVVDDKTRFVMDIFGYAKEREMIGLFWEILSYVGIPAGRQHHHIC
ncbi:unnamed protein product [Cylindrotheca closterium]|uniref:Uncharacterized protein n=1 Tax=Cylindrotheca closterium TaxID=2856 RepID=A0AAD2PWC0_9STRA|nr:unnamed protein product [Cylindrotheca closterium]